MNRPFIHPDTLRAIMEPETRNAKRVQLEQRRAKDFGTFLDSIMGKDLER